MNLLVLISRRIFTISYIILWHQAVEQLQKYKKKDIPSCLIGIRYYSAYAMVIYTTCNEPPFDAHRLSIPSYNIKCNPAHKRLMCKEAVPMLDYLIEFYGKFQTRKLIFIHGHEKSWHYKSSIIDVINSLIKTENFRSNEYGGLFRETWHHQNVFTLNDHDGLEYQQMYRDIYGNTSVFRFFKGNRIAFPCCSTFYINTELIDNNPLSLYEIVRERLVMWASNRFFNNLTPVYCSYFMEFSWNLLFNFPYVDPKTAEYP